LIAVVTKNGEAIFVFGRLRYIIIALTGIMVKNTGRYLCL